MMDICPTRRALIVRDMVSTQIGKNNVGGRNWVGFELGSWPTLFAALRFASDRGDCIGSMCGRGTEGDCPSFRRESGILPPFSPKFNSTLLHTLCNLFPCESSFKSDSLPKRVRCILRTLVSQILHYHGQMHRPSPESLAENGLDAPQRPIPLRTENWCLNQKRELVVSVLLKSNLQAFELC